MSKRLRWEERSFVRYHWVPRWCNIGDNRYPNDFRLRSGRPERHRKARLRFLDGEARKDGSVGEGRRLYSHPSGS